jgi:predicted transcriptional regulator
METLKEKISHYYRLQRQLDIYARNKQKEIEDSLEDAENFTVWDKDIIDTLFYFTDKQRAVEELEQDCNIDKTLPDTERIKLITRSLMKLVKEGIVETKKYGDKEFFQLTDDFSNKVKR